MGGLDEIIEPFTYSIWWGFFAWVLLVGLISFISDKFWQKRKQKKAIEDDLCPISEPMDLNYLKRHYMRLIETVEEDYLANRITLRFAYQRLSNLVRLFVYQATNVPVHKYTLAEINKLNIPRLSVLIHDYYDPEFAKFSSKNFTISLANTRKVIREWR